MSLMKNTEPVKLVNESNKFKFIHFTVFDDSQLQCYALTTGKCARGIGVSKKQN